MKYWCVFLMAAAAAGADVQQILNGIEKRYNTAQTLRVQFTETYQVQGRRRQMESGELFLRKPGRMRWQYYQPPGKLFVSDGKFVYYYSPETNRAEKMKLKETEDMRAPLAFLIGRLNFKDDFKEFRTRTEDGNTWITAIPKSDRAPYTEVSFVTAPDFSIRRLIVTGVDRSVLEFTFANEARNPKIADTLFRFEPPQGAEYVDLSQ
jgi:outer membrane lipoprotein carrier protein